MATAEAAAPTLAVSGLQAWYGESHILHGVDFEVRPGEVVTLLGRNGAGKTTTLKAIMGIVGKRSRLGRLRRPRDDRPVVRPHRAPRHGDLPRGARHLRQPQRAREPAAAAARRAAGGLTLERIFALFPNLAERLAQRRRQAVGRRAADAGDRAHPAHRRAVPDARRADRGPGAGDHPADRPHHRRAEARGLHHSAGRAELPLRRDGRRTATTSWSTAASPSASPTPTSTPTTWRSCMCDSASDAAPAGGQGGVRR